MKTTWMASTLTVVVALGLSSSVLAQSCGGEKMTTAQAKSGCDAAAKANCSKTCDAAAKASCSKSCDPKCTGSALVKSGAPLMQFKLADQSTACPKQACEWTKGDCSKLHFVVNNKEYNDKQEAIKAYTVALNDYFEQLTSVSYAVGNDCVKCPTKAHELAKQHNQQVKFRLASFTYDNQDAAKHAAVAAREAADKVSMKMVVDGKEYCCMSMAKKACDSSCSKEKQMAYKVGDTETKCKATAEMELAKARVIAAHAALSNGSHNETKETTEVVAGA